MRNLQLSYWPKFGCWQTKRIDLRRAFSPQAKSLLPFHRLDGTPPSNLTRHSPPEASVGDEMVHLKFGYCFLSSIILGAKRIGYSLELVPAHWHTLLPIYLESYLLGWRRVGILISSSREYCFKYDLKKNKKCLQHGRVVLMSRIDSPNVLHISDFGDIECASLEPHLMVRLWGDFNWLYSNPTYRSAIWKNQWEKP